MDPEDFVRDLEDPDWTPIDTDWTPIDPDWAPMDPDEFSDYSCHYGPI